jgi:PhnB protein
MAQLSPHLTFDGNCAEAFNFYKSVFGGEFSVVMKYGDVPVDAPMPPNTESGRLVHISLPISAETVLMGCDMPAGYGEAIPGNNFNISISAASTEEADKLFSGLSAGGSVRVPMDNTFWGAYFGMLTDKFGINWMVGYDKPQQ